MMAERNERLYLADIRDAIERVLVYTTKGRDAFFADPMMQDAVARNLEIMGEAVKGLSQATRDSTPRGPLEKDHGHARPCNPWLFRVDLDIVWEIVEKEIPALREKIASMLAGG